MPSRARSAQRHWSARSALCRARTATRFDIAREGYVSLLGGARPVSTADTPHMVRARRDLLASGVLARVTDAVVRAATACVSSERPGRADRRRRRDRRAPRRRARCASGPIRSRHRRVQARGPGGRSRPPAHVRGGRRRLEAAARARFDRRARHVRLRASKCSGVLARADSRRCLGGRDSRRRSTSTNWSSRSGCSPSTP